MNRTWEWCLMVTKGSAQNLSVVPVSGPSSAGSLQSVQADRLQASPVRDLMMLGLRKTTDDGLKDGLTCIINPNSPPRTVTGTRSRLSAIDPSLDVPFEEDLQQHPGDDDGARVAAASLTEIRLGPTRPVTPSLDAAPALRVDSAPKALESPSSAAAGPRLCPGVTIINVITSKTDLTAVLQSIRAIYAPAPMQSDAVPVQLPMSPPSALRAGVRRDPSVKKRVRSLKKRVRWAPEPLLIETRGTSSPAKVARASFAIQDNGDDSEKEAGEEEDEEQEADEEQEEEQEADAEEEEEAVEEEDERNDEPAITESRRSKKRPRSSVSLPRFACRKRGCDKSYAHRFSLQRHVRVDHARAKDEQNTKAQQAQPAEANPKPNQKSKKKSHKKKEVNDLFPCPEPGCDKIYATRHSLVRHGKWHAGTFSCDLCEYKANTASNLKRHLQTHQSFDTNDDTKPIDTALSSFLAHDSLSEI